MTPVVGILFSRDRAMQLDCTIKSLMAHCADIELAQLFILYRTTGALHAAQYAELRQEYARCGFVSFVEESSFRNDLLRLLDLSPAPAAIATGRKREGTFSAILRRLQFRGRYVLFLVDDNVSVRDFELGALCKALATSRDAIGFSLRLGANVTYSYSNRHAQAAPEFQRLPGGLLKFDWSGAQGDFGYPLELSSSLYRLSDLSPLLTQLAFENPNALEYELATHTSALLKRRPKLLCFEQSATFCNPANKVQTVFANPAGIRPQYSSDRLAEMFQEGYRINAKAYAGFVPVSCHQEVALTFEKPSGERQACPRSA
jgi:hypothetical protein